MKLGISSQGLQEFILYKTWFDNKKISNSEGTGKCKSKKGGEIPVRINLGEKTSLVPSSVSCILFSSWLLISSHGVPLI
jgi:hypothetical protein